MDLNLNLDLDLDLDLNLDLDLDLDFFVDEIPLLEQCAASTMCPRPSFGNSRCGILAPWLSQFLTGI